MCHSQMMTLLRCHLDCYPASSMYTCYSVKVAAICSYQWTGDTSAVSCGGRLRSGNTKLSWVDCVTCSSICSFPFWSFDVISFGESDCPNLVSSLSFSFDSALQALCKARISSRRLSFSAVRDRTSCWTSGSLNFFRGRWPVARVGGVGKVSRGCPMEPTCSGTRKQSISP